MSRLDKLRAAGNDASEKAKQKIPALNTIQVQQLIDDLQKECVDPLTISALQSAIDDATERNKLITDLVNKGGAVGKCVADIVAKIL